MSWTDGIETTVTKEGEEWKVTAQRGNVVAQFMVKPSMYGYDGRPVEEVIELCKKFGQRAILDKEIEDEFGTDSLAVAMIRRGDPDTSQEFLLSLLAYESNARHGKHSWDGEPPVGDEIDQRIIAYIMENSKPYPEMVGA